MRQVVVISGRTCTGKSALADCLVANYGFVRFRTSKFLQEYGGKSSALSKTELKALGDKLDLETKSRWVFSEYESLRDNLPNNPPFVIDSIRTSAQLDFFRECRNIELVHVHLYAPMAELLKRFKSRQEALREASDAVFEDSDFVKNEQDVESFKNDADVRINTIRTDTRDNLVRVAARLGLYSAPNVRCVDVIVGGQYGSEGKGHISAYLAKDYDVLVRVGGPNAGHTVSSSSGVFTYHQLPSGARDVNAELLLGPGMTMKVDELLKEIDECGITPDRLYIDPQVMIIEDRDVEQEQGMVQKIGSTGRGGGAAASRRILSRSPGMVKLARDIPALAPYVGTSEPYRGSTADRLEIAYRKGQSILLEGTQGSGLSLFHGSYPYVTSRDTNVAGCLAEAGISPSRVRRILLVVRPTPIRVGNPDPIEGQERQTSGPLKHETNFAEVAELAKLNVSELEKNELTSTTKRKRRVGWFEWEQFRKACCLNAPTDIVLTFADYISASNEQARRFEQLSLDTIKFIEELERIAQAPVSLINTRFPRNPNESIDLRTVIDRRNWASRRQVS